MIAIFLGLLALAGAALAEFEIVNGPGENSTLACNESWVAWENNTAPFYAEYVQYTTFYDIEFNGTLINITYPRVVIQVLDGSMPIIPVAYFEEGENGTRGRPVICRNPPTAIPSQDETALAAVIFTTSSLGIIASIIALVTYLLLKPLRTLPGLVIMNLFLAFLLAGIMLQIRIAFEYHGMNYVINYTLWAGLLIARFTWMNLTGIEMCRSLYRGVQMRIKTQSCHKRVLLTVYMVVGWGIPIILAVIMFVVESKAKSTKVKKLFGGAGYLTHIVPIAVSQLINIGMVVFVSVVFCSAAKRQRKLRQYSYNKQKVNFVRLFLVILTALGVVWIAFLVLVSIPDATAQQLGVVITYTILTDTQPVFVCIAFVCTPKVYHMYLVRFHIRREDKVFRRSQRTGTVLSAMNSKEMLNVRQVTPVSQEVNNDSNLERTWPLIPTTTGENANNTVSNGRASSGSMAPVTSTSVTTTPVYKLHINGERREDETDSLPHGDTGVGHTQRESCARETYSAEKSVVAAQSNTHPANHSPSLTTSYRNRTLNPDREETHI